MEPWGRSMAGKVTRAKILSDMETEYLSTPDPALKRALGKDLLKLRGWDKPDGDAADVNHPIDEKTLDKILSEDDDGLDGLDFSDFNSADHG